MAGPDLPNEIILMIAQYLTPRGIANLMQGNHELYSLLQGDLIYDCTLGSERNGVLLWASQHGRDDVACAMLQRQGEFPYRDWKGSRLNGDARSELELALRFAAFYGHTGIIRLLLDWNIESIRSDLRALPTAASRGHLEAVKELLAYSLKVPESQSTTPISETDFIEEEHSQSYPSSSWSPSQSHRHSRFLNQAFEEAIKREHDEIIGVFLADGRARISLAKAARAGSERFVKLCCQHEKPNTLDREGESPLRLAAKEGHEGVLQILFDAGWDTNLRDSNGRTALLAACNAGQETIVKDLLRREDIIPDLACHLGKTPLLEAARKGHAGIIDALLRTRRVNVNPVTSSGQSALSLVAQRGNEDAVRLLLSAGAEPDAQDQLGRTPLSLAAEAGFPAVVRLLLATEGVDPNSKCQNNRTPLVYALLSGRFPGRVNGEKVHPNDDQDELEVLSILRGSLDEKMACLKVEVGVDAPGDDAGLVIMRELLSDQRVDPNSRDAKGRSVLCLSILRGEIAAVRLLLTSKKIDLKSKVYRNLTPVDLVKEKYKRKRLNERRLTSQDDS